ncbi:MAG: hypothetical protein U0183_24010 [Polyangiaceae bacterium]
MRIVHPWLFVLLVAAPFGCSGAFGIAGGEEPREDAAAPPARDAGATVDATSDAVSSTDAKPDADATIDAGPRDRWVFFSEKTTTGRIASEGRVGPSGADALCTDEGRVLGATLTFKALVNTDDERPWDRVAPAGTPPRAYAMPTPAGPIRVFTAQRTNPLVPILRHANGQEEGGLQVLFAKAWTGFDAPANCNNWSSASSAASSSFGDATSLTQWLRAGESTCTEARHLYCFEVD